MLKLLYFICSCGFFASATKDATETGAILPGCVEPKMECPNVNITFWLYTRANKDNPHQIWAGNSSSIKSAPWVADAPVKILIHGYTGYKDFSPNTEIRPAFMKCCDYNIISLDYNPIARKPCYISAARNTRLVGMCTAQLIDDLILNHGFKLERFHPIGFSLGAQTVGFVGNYVKSGRLHRITALDPSLPLFLTNDDTKKVDKNDALFVDALHTNALSNGQLEPSGSVDFYANGGISQPGCTESTHLDTINCDHSRAPAYYAESINSHVGCYAFRCPTWFSFIMGWCEPNKPEDSLLYGEYVPYNSSGLYFFNTNSKSPYCRGKNKKPTRSNAASYISSSCWSKLLDNPYVDEIEKQY